MLIFAILIAIVLLYPLYQDIDLLTRVIFKLLLKKTSNPHVMSSSYKLIGNISNFHSEVPIVYCELQY